MTPTIPPFFGNLKWFWQRLPEVLDRHFLGVSIFINFVVVAKKAVSINSYTILKLEGRRKAPSVFVPDWSLSIGQFGLEHIPVPWPFEFSFGLNLRIKRELSVQCDACQTLTAWHALVDHPPNREEFPKVLVPQPSLSIMKTN